MLEWVADFEAKYSRFIESSLISRINAAAGMHPVEIDEETERLLSLCSELHFMTQGVFDPTALPLIKLWNWKATPVTLPDESAIAAARELVGWRSVQRSKGSVFLPRKGMSLDLGGIGKEYAVDMAAQMAAQYGITDLLVDFGQDLRVLGAPPGRPAWHIGLEDPKAPGTCWGSVGANDAAVATSGDYLRHFVAGGRRYGHIIDPRSGYPVDNGTLSVTVVAPSCTMAGLLSTTAFILGPEAGLDLIQRTYNASGVVSTENQRFFTPRIHEYLVNH
jgi:thiamine biosynthesis lipoprotein